MRDWVINNSLLFDICNAARCKFFKGERSAILGCMYTELVEISVSLRGLMYFNIHSTYQQLIDLQSISAEDAENQSVIIQIRTHHKTAFSSEVAGERWRGQIILSFVTVIAVCKSCNVVCYSFKHRVKAWCKACLQPSFCKMQLIEDVIANTWICIFCSFVLSVCTYVGR